MLLDSSFESDSLVDKPMVFLNSGGTFDNGLLWKILGSKPTTPKLISE